jgi:hypothetical protein
MVMEKGNVRKRRKSPPAGRRKKRGKKELVKPVDFLLLTM